MIVRRRRRHGVAAAFGLGVLMIATDADAHAFAERYDLPLPIWYYLAGAGATVGLSFAAAALLITRRGSARPREPVDLDRFALWRLLTTPALVALARVSAVGLFVVAIVAGYAGSQAEPLDNPLPVAVWVLWWVGLTNVCALAGDFWRVLSPVRIVAEWTSTLVRRWSQRARPARPLALGQRATLVLPARCGMWPAVGLFFVFVCAEVAWPENAVPAKLATVILIYCMLTWVAMAVVGIEPWLERGDPFAAFFGLVSRFAPLDVDRRSLRPYGAGLARGAPVSASAGAFVLLALATVSFDGLRETPVWNELSSATLGWLYRLGALGVIGNVTAGALVKVVGLAVTPVVFLAGYLASCWGSAVLVGRAGRNGHPWTTGRIARQFASSLVPIAIAYHVAHYLSYLLIQGQAIVPLVSDPFGWGWDLFGTRAYQPDLAIVSMQFVWGTCLGAIVLGHVAAVLIAHVVAIRVFDDRRAAVRSQYPLLALMIAYTMFSLWVLSQPIVEG